MGIGRSEGGPRWRRRVFELVSNSGTTVVWPALETNVVSKQKKSSVLDCSPCGEVLGEDEEGVEGGAPAPHLAIYVVVVVDDDFELFIMINYQLRVAHWHGGHPRLNRIIDKKNLTPSPGSATPSTSAEVPDCN